MSTYVNKNSLYLVLTKTSTYYYNIIVFNTKGHLLGWGDISCKRSDGGGMTLTVSSSALTPDSRESTLENAFMVLPITSITSYGTNIIKEDTSPLPITNNVSNTDVCYYLDKNSKLHVYVFPKTEQEQTEITFTYSGGSTTFNYDSEGKFYYLKELTADTTVNMIISGGSVPTEPTITNNVTNTVVAYTGDNPYTVTLTCNSGYVFSAAPTISYMDSDGESHNDSMTLNDDSTVATITTSTMDLAVSDGITVNGSTEIYVPTPIFVNNISNTTITYTGEVPDLTVRIKCDSGYMFSAAPTLTYYSNDSQTTVTETCYLGSDSTIATGSVNGLSEDSLTVTANGNTEVIPTPTPTITNNVDNTVATYTGDNPYTVTLTCNSGYMFSAAPTISYTDSDGEPHNDSMTLNDDSTVATITTSSVDTDILTLTLDGNTEVIPTPTPTPTFDNQIANTTVGYSGSDHQYTVTITCNTGYKFSEAPEASYTSYSGGTVISATFALSSDSRTASAILPDLDEDVTVTLTGTTEQITPTTAITVETNLTNCTSDAPSTVYVGDTLNVTVTANDGTLFDATQSTPRFVYMDSSGYFNSIDFTISSDNKTANGVTTVGSWDSLTVIATAYPQTVVGDNYGAINVYRVTLDELDSFSKKRFFSETQSDESVQLINLGDYVHSIHRMFFDVADSSTDVIKCGNYNTKVSCHAPENDVVTIDFGTLTITAHNNDSTDYNGELMVFVPFKGMINISTDYIGKTVGLTYKINIISGEGVATLTCGDDVIQYIDVTPSQDIYYRTTAENRIGGDSWNSTVMYGLEPYVKVKYYDTLSPNRNSTQKTCELNALSGYNEVDGVTLVTTDKMTVDEQTEILQLLSEGVYFEPEE